MANTYSWRILGVDSNTNHQGHDDVVYAVQYRVDILVDGIPSASHADRVGITFSDESFVPRNEVSDDLLVTWVKNEIGIDAENAIYATLSSMV